MFKIGDKVKIVPLSDSRVSDLGSDYLCDVEEGVITGSNYDKIWDILERVQSGKSPTFTIIEKQVNEYGLCHSNVKMRYLFPETELIKIDG